MKKLISLVLALAMIMMVGAAFADGDGTSSLPKATISISNLEDGDEVSLYKIIKWNNTVSATTPDWEFNGISLTNYPTVKDLKTALEGEGTDASAAMTALAAAVGSSQLVETKAVEGTSYSIEAEVGSYLALIKAAGSTMYNPMVLSVNFDYSENPTIASDGTINADTAVTGTNGIAKKQPVDLKKDVNDAEDKKHDIAVGDSVPFIVTTNTPNYGSNYSNPVFTITDTLSTGLEMTDDQQNSIVVKNNGTALTAKADGVTEYDYEITTTKSGYVINFSKKYLLSVKANTSVTVEYEATVNEKAVMHNVEEYVNDVDLVFSNSPSTTDDSLHDDTKHYTFSIDASLLKKEGGDEVTKELVKIGVNAETNEVITSWKTSASEPWESITPLKGAHFTLVRNDDSNYSYEADSDEDGYLNFTGLDAGTYTLTETSAPDGYKFSKDGVPVVISANYNDDGTLNEYTITVNGENKSTYTATNEGEWTHTTTIKPNADTTGFINEKAVTLPSTGGIGTTIFYILGGLLVVGAAVILIARRKAQD